MRLADEYDADSISAVFAAEDATTNRAALSCRSGLLQAAQLELLTRIAMPEPDRMIRIRTVLDRTGISRSNLYRKMAEGSFPQALKLGEHSAGWRESAVNRWIADPAGWRPTMTTTDRVDASRT